jgi:hypothetical protein
LTPLDVDAPVLHRLNAVRDHDQLARGEIGVSEWARLDGSSVSVPRCHLEAMGFFPLMQINFVRSRRPSLAKS